MNFLKTKLTALILVVVLIGLLYGCEQLTTKTFGGNMTVNLPKNEKLVLATWKEDNFWYLTKPMKDNDIAETYLFREQSLMGIAQGTVKIIEHK